MPVMLAPRALDALMPMNLQLDAEGRVAHVGPTLAKARPPEFFAGRSVFEVFRFKRPREISTIAELTASAGTPLRLVFRDDPKTQLRGEVTACCDGGGLVLNLSFGLSVLEAIRLYGLHAGDFATTDPTMEMLYLIEAKSAAMEETRDLNLRLQGARIAAEEQAFTDTLTGLKNRRALDHVLGRYQHAGTPFTLVGLDLDYFKQVNDSLGHAAGDCVLQHVARVMLSNTSDGDTIVRTGGDEFLIVLRDETDPAGAADLGEALVDALEQPIALLGTTCHISASIGICSTSQLDGWQVRDMLRHVDAALFASKRAGRGRVTVYTAGMVPEAGIGEPKDARLRARPDPADPVKPGPAPRRKPRLRGS